MFPAERQRRIVHMLQREPGMSVHALAKALHVSAATVRRDLAALEEKGLIRRARGGAMLSGQGFGVEPPLIARSTVHPAEKMAIARAAAASVRDGQVVALDVGTTTIELAKTLRSKRNVTVFTNSIPAATALAGSANQVYLVGGLLRHGELSLVGAMVRDMVSRFRFDTFFLGAAGFDPEGGFSDYSIEDVEIKRIFMARARETVALVDHSKWGVQRLAQICETSAVSTIYTDDGVDPDLVRQVEQLGGRVIVVAVERPDTEGSSFASA